ncbi:MAG: hypothetical protein ABIG61_12570 [Planctomycetota bacterium]
MAATVTVIFGLQQKERPPPWVGHYPQDNTGYKNKLSFMPQVLTSTISSRMGQKKACEVCLLQSMLFAFW